MPNPIIAVAGASLGSAAVQANAAKKAAGAQTAAADAGVAEQRRQFDTIRELMQPYVGAGETALGWQKGLMGLTGEGDQQWQINQLAQGPEFTELVRQGENAILQNASATGGIRGGNVQGALAQFRPQMLQQVIDRRFAQLGGLASAGQNAAAGLGNAAMQTGQNVSQLMQQSGAAQAGGSLAAGQAYGNFLGGVGGMIGRFGIPDTGIPQGQTMFTRWGF